ncbi:hypothetical protein BU23DRAFT_61910 [Bimuria novae-zelandiae CBS 107.79]|uniref:Uncharacterized protein n=1 Tax=Bimuria novae-zelandiae CBS 107.79 TaxID=1447943 RepID=A0A6A5UHV5_9PLEO|nr:hypothetical protein BU23DRAFT_61910 [Bimuria novae-zelandiae CBS 107.79]
MPRAAGLPSNDADLVRYTRYSKKAGVLPDLPRVPPPEWQPLPINNPHKFGEPQIPKGTDIGSPVALFDLFFDADVLDRVAHIQISMLSTWRQADCQHQQRVAGSLHHRQSSIRTLQLLSIWPSTRSPRW